MSADQIDAKFLPWHQPAIDHYRDDETGDHCSSFGLQVDAGFIDSGAYVWVIGEATRFLDIKPVKEDGFEWQLDCKKDGLVMWYGRPTRQPG